MNQPLRDKNCAVCKAGGTPLKGIVLSEMKKQIDPSWEVVNDHHLLKSYKFKDFISGLKFVNAIGELAEKEGHHPDLFLSYTKVEVKLFTHKIKGLSESDFVMADKIDALYAFYQNPS